MKLPLNVPYGTEKIIHLNRTSNYKGFELDSFYGSDRYRLQIIEFSVPIVANDVKSHDLYWLSLITDENARFRLIRYRKMRTEY